MVSVKVSQLCRHRSHFVFAQSFGVHTSNTIPMDDCRLLPLVHSYSAVSHRLDHYRGAQRYVYANLYISVKPRDVTQK